MKTKSNKASLLIGVSVASSFFSWFNFSPEAVVFAMPPQKVVLQSDSGNYLGRCNDCVPRGAYPDSAFVHVLQGDLMNSPWAQFDVKQLPNGNYVLQSDNGKY
jgi:hypothetical protein